MSEAGAGAREREKEKIIAGVTPGVRTVESEKMVCSLTSVACNDFDTNINKFLKIDWRFDNLIDCAWVKK